MNWKRFLIAFGAIILCILILWWLYVAVLVNEDINEEEAYIGNISYICSII